MLEYLFIAETHNGMLIKQDQEDKPRYQSHGSTFSDVLKENVKKFSLVGKGHVFTVDLQDGHFEVDGRILYTQLPPEKADLRLIYYRQTQQTMTASIDGNSSPTTVIRYYIGWQCTVKGKNYKYELGVD